MEAYSLSLGNKTVVEPNIAIQSVNFSSESTVQPTGIRFTVRKGELFVSCACNGREHSATNHK